MRRLLLVTSLLCLPSSAMATVLLDWDLGERVARADRIVIATIGAETSVRVDGRVMTETGVTVERTLHGTHVARFTLSQLGGREGSIVHEVVGTARLFPGRRMLLITHRGRDGRRYLVGMSQGAYLLEADGRISQRIDASLMTRDGRFLPPPGRRTTLIRDVEAAIATKKAR